MMLGHVATDRLLLEASRSRAGMTPWCQVPLLLYPLQEGHRHERSTYLPTQLTPGCASGWGRKEEGELTVLAKGGRAHWASQLRFECYLKGHLTVPLLGQKKDHSDQKSMISPYTELRGPGSLVELPAENSYSCCLVCWSLCKDLSLSLLQ